MAEGILYQGRWERFYRRVSRLLRLVRGRLIEELFACSDLEAQRMLLAERWDTPRFRRLCVLLCHPAVSRLSFGDPAYWRGVMPGASRYLVERMQGALRRHLARASFMQSLVLRGRLPPEDLPPHLTPEGVQRLRQCAAGLRVVTADVCAIAREQRMDFSRFSLSDVGSFQDRASFGALLQELARGRTGARFCIREFLRRHPWPAGEVPDLVREPTLEAELAIEDRSFAYDFLVGEVRRG